MKTIHGRKVLSPSEMVAYKACLEPNNLASTKGTVMLSDKTCYKVSTLHMAFHQLKKVGYIVKDGNSYLPTSAEPMAALNPWGQKVVKNMENRIKNSNLLK